MSSEPSLPPLWGTVATTSWFASLTGGSASSVATVRVTDSGVVGRSGSLEASIAIVRWTSPSLISPESRATVTSWLWPGATVPDVGVIVSHSGICVPGASVVPVTAMTRCVSGDPMADIGAGSGIPHTTDRREDGADATWAVEPAETQAVQG